MLISQYYLQDGAMRLKNFEKFFRTTSDLDVLKTRFYGITIDMMFAAEESFFCMNDYAFKLLKDELVRSTLRVKEVKDVEEFKIIINTLVENYFPDDRNYSEKTMTDFRYSVREGATKYMAIEPYNLSKISEAINALPVRTVNMLDPRCRDGKNLEALSTSIQGSETWGVELEPSTAEKAKAKINHIAMGTLLGSRISNEVFDILFSELPITWMTSPGSSLIIKQEKNFVHSVLKYVRPNGVIVFTIPYFRMYKDMCVLFSRYLDNVQVRKLSGKDFYDKGLITIIGTKASRKEPDEKIYKMLRKLHNIDPFDDIISKNLDRINLPENALSVETFRGSILDMDEMAKIVKSSGCMNSFWDSQSVEKLSENVKQPLLPFNIGQIGLVLTSGCLDGIVDEGDGSCHVIKGRVSKQSTVERDLVNNDNQIEVNETITNHVEINVFMPNGEYKILA